MIDTQYEDLLKRVLTHGYLKDDRTGTGTMSLFGPQLRYDMANGFPLITTKRVYWRGVVEELLWFLEGDTNVKTLQDKGVHIWDAWEDPARGGDLGPIYGAQWRHWQGLFGQHDQIAQVIESIKYEPDSRRHIVSAWNPGELDLMVLPPCHAFFQFYVRGHRLDLQLYQRSADMFLGVPFNIASYSLLLHMMARETGLTPGEFVWTAGDAHVYLNHQDQVFEQLDRPIRPFPELEIVRGRGETNLKGWSFGDFELQSYTPHPSISAPVAV